MPYTIKIKETEYTIDDKTIEELERYVHYGEIPGDFLCAILRNNFADVVTLADGHNLQNLPAFAKYLWWEIPGSSWGSTEKILKWCAHDGMSGYGKKIKQEEKNKDEGL